LPGSVHRHSLTLREMGGGASTLAIAAGDETSEDIVIATFEDIDVNGSGTLTLSEIKDAVTKYGGKISAEWSPEMIDRALAMFDMDKDGRLNQTEFLAVLRAVEEEKPPKPPLMRTLFGLMDQDGDGKIDGNEATEVAKALNVNADQLWDVFLDYDDTSSAEDRKHKMKITYPEFSTAIKGTLLGMLKGNSKKKIKEMDPELEEAIAKLEKKGFKVNGKKKKKKGAAAPPAPLEKKLTFKKMTEEEKDALLKLYEEQQEKAKKAAEEEEAAMKEEEAADEAAKQAAKAKTEEKHKAAVAAKEAAVAAEPKLKKDENGDWVMETQEEADERVKPVEVEEEDDEDPIGGGELSSAILSAAGDDAEMAAKIAKKIEEARLGLEQKMKEKEEAAIKAAEDAEKAAAAAKAAAEAKTAARKAASDKWIAEEKAKKAAAA